MVKSKNRYNLNGNHEFDLNNDPGEKSSNIW